MSAGPQKGARFVSKCDAFGIPLLVLVDTPGFMPGTRQESEGVIRFGAALVHAFAEATVPRVTVITRKAFGGAFITMNSKDLGADYVFAWPQAEIGVMGAKPAVGIIHRRELAAADDPEATREDLAQRYAETQLRPDVAARAGYIDELINPADTRRRLAWAFGSLEWTDPNGNRNRVARHRSDHGRHRVRGHGSARPVSGADRTEDRAAGAGGERRCCPGAGTRGAAQPVRSGLGALPRPRAGVRG